LPDEAFHRNVDKIVLEAGAQHAASVKTAVVCPPTIYGTFCSPPHPTLGPEPNGPQEVSSI
jgi:hypothetical protein